MKLKSISSRQNDPFLNFLVLTLSIAGTAGTLFFDSAHAEDGIWSADTPSLFWSTSQNWESGVVADGSGFTANFTNDITDDRVVDLDGDQTITNIIFGDSDITTAGSWTIGNNSVSTNNLILAGTTPTITVNALGTGKTATISTIIEGTAGLTKAGTGTLILTGANTYSGTTTIGEGTLAFTTNTPSLAGGLTFGDFVGSITNSALDLSDGNVTFDGASLAQTNSATANSITIGSGRTLTFNDNVTTGANANGTTTRLTATGAGTMAVNKTGGTFQIGGATGNTSANSATLDLSQLSTFTANLGTPGIFRIGDNNTTTGSWGNPSGGSSTVVLAGSNTITASIVGIGDVSAQNTLQTLKLGSTSNTINTNTLVVGAKGASTTTRSNGLLNFNTETGTLQLRAANGTGRAVVDVANHQMFTGVATTGTIDLSGHSSDLLISTLNIGHRSGGVSNVTGTFSFDTGTLDVTSAVVGKRTGQSSGTSTATLNIAGGTSAFGTIAMGDANTAGSTANGTLNLSGGTVTLAGNITRTGGNGTTIATINLSGATLDMGGFNIGSGTNNVTLNAESGTLKNVGLINGTGGLTKTTADTLILDGTNTYTGDTTVSEGTLSLTSASLADDSTVSVDSGATLNLPHGTTDIVGTLILDGTTYTSGTFNASTPGSFISGSGSIQVGIVEGFANWIDTNYPALLDKTEGGDPDFDGITNLMEYVLNGNPGTSSTNILPAADNSDPTDLIFTFTRREESADDTTQVFQYGTNLSGWTDISITGTPGAEVTLAPPALGLQLVTVKVPKSAAVPSGKLFGRLQVTKP